MRQWKTNTFFNRNCIKVIILKRNSLVSMPDRSAAYVEVYICNATRLFILAVVPKHLTDECARSVPEINHLHTSDPHTNKPLKLSIVNNSLCSAGWLYSIFVQLRFADSMRAVSCSCTTYKYDDTLRFVGRIRKIIISQ